MSTDYRFDATFTEFAVLSQLARIAPVMLVGAWASAFGHIAERPDPDIDEGPVLVEAMHALKLRGLVGADVEVDARVTNALHCLARDGSARLITATLAKGHPLIRAQVAITPEAAVILELLGPSGLRVACVREADRAIQMLSDGLGRMADAAVGPVVRIAEGSVNLESLLRRCSADDVFAATVARDPETPGGRSITVLRHDGCQYLQFDDSDAAPVTSSPVASVMLALRQLAA